MHSFFQYIKNFLITLRFSILSIFVALFVVSIVFLIEINYKTSSDSLLFSAKSLLTEVSANIYTELSREIAKAESDDLLSSQLIQDKTLNSNDIHELTNYTYELANQFNVVQAAYWGDENGNLINARYEPDDSIATEIVNRKSGAKTLIYRDIKGNVINTVNSNDLSYDPRNRPWYIAAKNAKKTIWTDIYLFKEFHYLGVTVATPVYLNQKLAGVFGLDIRLDWLSWYIGEQKISQNALIFIVSKEGQLIAFPKLYENQEFTKLVDIHDFKYPVMAEAFDLYKINSKSQFTFNFDHTTYLVSFKQIPQFAMHQFLIGIVVPENDFVSELVRANLINTGIGMVVLIISILIVSNLITRIVTPIKKLVKRTEKIKRFELDDDKKIPSRIKEVVMLSDAILSMQSGLKSFKKYVPADLVRQLIEKGEDVKIGGTKKQLAIFFSDLDNFTTMAEHMDPNILMEHMCEYFDEMSKIIASERGTIDKFIGDSIMAFWGAPTEVTHSCEKAARAALNCIKRLNELNDKWKQQGKAPLFMRIGIHIGDAIVGNVGSADRLNYTALGDTINIASRLEGLNKTYNTRIIVSEDVYHIIKDQFVLRKLDCVALKGKTLSTNIYELLSEKKSDIKQSNS